MHRYTQGPSVQHARVASLLSTAAVVSRNVRGKMLKLPRAGKHVFAQKRAPQLTYNACKNSVLSLVQLGLRVCSG